jgi:hypothetical protein
MLIETSFYVGPSPAIRNADQVPYQILKKNNFRKLRKIAQGADSPITEFYRVFFLALLNTLLRIFFFLFEERALECK